MPSKKHYIAVYTDCEMLFGCNHQHKTVISANACISEPGGYVIAVRKGKYMALTEAEDAAFLQTKYGQHERVIKRPDPSLCVVRVRG
jgi:hypothetical protein